MGYLIDKKTAEKYHITNIEQLKDPKIASLFDANGDGKADMTGCTPGWGCDRGKGGVASGDRGVANVVIHFTRLADLIAEFFQRAADNQGLKSLFSDSALYGLTHTEHYR